MNRTAPVSLERVGFGQLLLRALISLAVMTIAVRIAANVVDGFDPGPNQWLTALLISLGSAVLGPLTVWLALPVFVYTAGLASLALNAGIVLLVANLLSGVRVDGFGSAVIVALVVTLVGMVAAWLLAFDDDATFSRAVVRRQVRRARPEAESDVSPGVLFLEIDGCSHGVLRRALRAGYLPTLHRWIRDGTHQLHGWECDLSSQTGASQAGLLLGSNEGIVAFRWFERDTQREVVSSRPNDATLIEQRLSTGRGLLADGGASRNNLFTGDAETSLMTLSTALSGGRAGRAWGVYFASADNVTRTLLSVIADVMRELGTSFVMRRRSIEPRLKKGWKYPLIRAATTVVLPDVTVDTLIGDMVRGAPSAYATFIGYDEVAHHDGVERPSALAQLRRLDRTFGRIDRARRYAARPYEIVVLSDHGQTQGATFLQRYGESLEEVFQREIGGVRGIRARTAGTEPAAQVSGALTEAMASGGLTARLAKGVAPHGELTGRGEAVDEHDASGVSAGDSPRADDVLVMASGNLGLIYFTGQPRRATLEEIEQDSPGLVDRLAQHPGIGFVLVRTQDGSSVAIGREGRVRITDGAVSGTDPLRVYGPNTLRHLQRHDRFEHIPDLLLISTYDPELDEVSAFEELIGSHGGIGGEQSHAFVLAPAHFAWPDEPVIGAGAVHDVLQEWIRQTQRNATPAP
ncbi:MAG: phage holin family protein [Gaiellales bacterium]